jgi:hypothetical protein
MGLIEKKDAKHYGDIESNLWRNNITFKKREKKDFLDVSAEDFSANLSVDIYGNKIQPSGFNIFRDSLRKIKEELHKKMIDNMPIMTIDGDVSSDASGSDVEGDIVPLDFRTAMVDGKLVIQAKPKDYRAVNETLEEEGPAKPRQNGEDQLDPDKVIGDLNLYLKSVRKEAFDMDDPDVILIQPKRSGKASYKDVLLPCEKEQRLNNCLSAPVMDGIR